MNSCSLKKKRQLGYSNYDWHTKWGQVLNIIDHAKELAELIKKYNDQDLYERIVSLREEILGLKEDNLSMKEQLKTLGETQTIQSKLLRKGNYYVLEDDPEGSHNIYCLACWDHDRKLISLYRGHPYKGQGTISCNICKARKKP